MNLYDPVSLDFDAIICGLGSVLIWRTMGQPRSFKCDLVWPKQVFWTIGFYTHILICVLQGMDDAKTKASIVEKIQNYQNDVQNSHPS